MTESPETPPLAAGVLRVELRPSVLAATVSAAAALRLATRRVHTFGLEAGSTHGGEATFTREGPRLSERDRQNIDELGVIRLGVQVRPHDIVFACTAPRLEHEARTPFDRERKDYSQRVPSGLFGEVTRVDFEPGGGLGGGASVSIDVTESRPVVVGDTLRMAGTDERWVVGQVSTSLEVDLLWPGRTSEGEAEVHVVALAHDALHARSIGPYANISGRPFVGKRDFGGQPFDETHQWALEERGAWRTLHEMQTYKSDDVRGRVHAYENIVRASREFVGSCGEGTRVWLRELEALGFDVRFEGSEDGEGRGPLELRLSSSARVRERSYGELRRPELLDPETGAPVDEGLHCARIFGPTRDYRCTCGKHHGVKKEGTVCEDCGVELMASSERRERFAHLELGSSFLHPFAVGAVATLLRLSRAGVEAVLRGESTLTGTEPELLDETGPVALLNVLEALPLDELARGSSSAGPLARLLVDNGVHPRDFFFDAWPVLPPALRPIVPTMGGGWARSDLNWLYARLLNRRNRLARLRELDAPMIILRSEVAMLQQCIFELANNEAQPEPAHHEGRMLRSIAHGLLGRPLGKGLDYSGVASVVPDATLAPHTIRLPRVMAKELFKPWAYQVLEEQQFVHTIKAAKSMVEADAPEALAAIEHCAMSRPVYLFPERDRLLPKTVAGFDVVLWDEAAVAMAPATAEALGISFAGGEVTVHVPVDSRAVREVRENLRELTPPNEGSGWLEWFLRGHVVGEATCASDGSLEACTATPTPCARCLDVPVGTPIGLQAARALAPYEERVRPAMMGETEDTLSDLAVDPRLIDLALRWPSGRGWVCRVADAQQQTVGDTLMMDALARAQDDAEHPLVSGFLGRVHDAAEHAFEEPHERPLPEILTRGPEAPREELLARRVTELELSDASYAALEKCGIGTIGEFIARRDAELLKGGFGRKTLREVKDVLASMAPSLEP